MKPIETPVYRPTARCILNSFLNSGKRHLILTGGRKTGKSTLLSELFPSSLPGITTWAEPGIAVYLKENLTGETARIGIFNPALPGKENRMSPIENGFETLGIPALKRCAISESEWISIDEIGYLEQSSAAYQGAIRSLMEKKRLAAVVRKQTLPFIREICLREDAFIVDMDHPYGNTGCVIMASGLGRRFGGNKLMADFRGEPLICRVIAATEGIFARRIVVTRHEDIAALCRERNIEVILHDLPYRSDTVRLGLEALSDTDACMFCPGDQPLLKQDTVASLALAGRNERQSIWRPAFDGVPAAPVLFPKWAYQELLSLPEGKGGGAIINRYPERIRLVPVRDRSELKDIDRPEDLDELIKI